MAAVQAETTVLGEGLVWREGVGGIACRDCKQWCHEGDLLHHSRRCDTKNQQPRYLLEEEANAKALAAQQAAPRRSAARDQQLRRWGRKGEIGRADEEEILDAVNRGALSVSDAMNRDF